MKNMIFTGTHGKNHIQGIAVDPVKGFIYYSFTTMLIKAKMDGTIVGSVGGLTGHLGCIDFRDSDGKVYGSLEYKNDAIGKLVNRNLGIDRVYEDAFYVVCFDVDRIDRMDMDACRDGIMTASYLSAVVEDFNGFGRNRAGEQVAHKYGCSGIDGTAFGPMPGSNTGKEYLFICYGIYSDLSRDDNDHQVILCYDPENLPMAPLSQKEMHRIGPDAPEEKFFVYTGNTRWGVQNLEYDAYTNSYFAAVYDGRKPNFPNFHLFQIDAAHAPQRKALKGVGEDGMCLSLKQAGVDGGEGIFGWRFPDGSTGLYAYGDGRYLICKNMEGITGQCGLILPYAHHKTKCFILDI